MKSRSFFSALIAAIVLLLLTSAIGFGWILSQSPLGLLKGSPTPNPSAIIFIPKNTPAMVSILVNPDRLAALRQVLVPAGLRRSTRAEFEAWRDSLLASTDLSYEQTIRPWLGSEITGAITSLDLDRDPSNGRQLGYLLALTTQDPQKSREFLTTFWQKRAASPADLTQESYQGTQITYGKITQVNPDDGVPLTLASAVVGDRFVLFANSPKALRNGINNAQATDLNLGNSPDYQRTLQSLPSNRVAFAYVNLPQLADLAGDRSVQEKLDTLVDRNLVTYKSLAFGFSITRQGLLADTALVPVEDSGKAVETVKATFDQPIGALQYLPTSSSVVAAGAHPKTQWQGLIQGTQGYSSLAKLLDLPVKAIEQQWNVKVLDDLLNWVEGEYAVALLPEFQKKADWIFVAARSRENAIQTGLSKINAIAQQQGLTIGKLPIDNQMIDAWTKLTPTRSFKGKRDNGLSAQVVLTHAQIGDYDVFTPSLGLMQQLLATPAADDRHPWDRQIAPLQTPNNGYLYLRWPGVKPYLEQQLPGLKLLEFLGQPLLNQLNAVTISSYGTSDGITRSGVLIQFD